MKYATVHHPDVSRCCLLMFQHSMRCTCIRQCSQSASPRALDWTFRTKRDWKRICSACVEAHAAIQRLGLLFAHLQLSFTPRRLLPCPLVSVSRKWCHSAAQLGGLALSRYHYSNTDCCLLIAWMEALLPASVWLTRARAWEPCILLLDVCGGEKYPYDSRLLVMMRYPVQLTG